ncbi:hypothetical protein RR48_01393 [Papilio machaon]|uniref:Uncharacterized protein n=1 Tax=Papilio machaon TaxID=76193 RepID=A0A0N0PBY6_PAPMA|nr:hypothetical protein RR48_01393 [Papilio machaon]
MRSPRRRVSPRRRPRPPPPPPRGARPPSPPDPRKSSPSGSSVSSCSDESCSVCSAKNKKTAPPTKPVKPGSKSPPRPVAKRPAPIASAPRAVQPTRELLKAREASKRTREEKVLEWQRTQMDVVGIKREGERRRPRPERPERPDRPAREGGVSPSAIAAALADSSSDSESERSASPAPQRLTLSERFGKMAQWSLDRSARLENMRITRREATLHVRIEGARSPSPAPAAPVAPVGSYPTALEAPAGLPAWDDVRVRYEHYKRRGYLRGLSLPDYVKWEEWWYKYQEWLKREQAYERWAEGEVPVGRRERRRRGGRHRRS